MVGIETSDDAAVYKITEEIALIQTVDFFTPVVDDPYLFGQIAAANSLSDVYAMGGEPKIALNIVAFPNCLDPSILGDILAGGADKVREAGAMLIGGHSVQDDEPKYGLCVSGFVRPDRVLKNSGAMAGDVLILTKQIGSGIINTAVKAEMADEAALREAVTVMTSLNAKAKRVMEKYPVHACTDITGFGLLGHCMEMAKGSGVQLHLSAADIPVMPMAAEYAQMGLVPAGAYRNRHFTEAFLKAEGVEDYQMDLFCDPQTSGGLLLSVPEACAEAAMRDFAEAGMDTSVAVIGWVSEKKDEPFIRVCGGGNGH